MLNMYERGITSDIIDPLFEDIKQSVIPLIKQNQKENKEIKIHATKEKLIEAAKFLLNYIGLDLNRSVIDIFDHGFTDKARNDNIRIAFKMTNNPVPFTLTAIHEGGHGIFEQNIKPSLHCYNNNTIENLYAIHESQSLFYENFLGKNINFWIPIFDEYKKILGLEVSLEEWVEDLNEINVSCTRIGADELSYCLHIILRYEIEKEIFNGHYQVDELENLWNQKMKEYFDLNVTKASEGILQDIHWSEGAFGYFPSYLLGKIYDGMIYKNIDKNLGNINELLKNGRIKEITDYLIEHIYQYGGAYDIYHILDNLNCEKKLTAKPLIDYFKEKYGK